MVAADDDKRIVQLTDGFEAREDNAQAGVYGQALAEIIGYVFAYIVHVGQKVGQVALQVVGL